MVLELTACRFQWPPPDPKPTLWPKVWSRPKVWSPTIFFRSRTSDTSKYVNFFPAKSSENKILFLGSTYTVDFKSMVLELTACRFEWPPPYPKPTLWPKVRYSPKVWYATLLFRSRTCDTSKCLNFFPIKSSENKLLFLGSTYTVDFKSMVH